MEASKTGNVRSLLLYGALLVGLLVVVVLGVLWAKNRADYYYASQQAPAAEQQQDQPEGGTPAAPSEDKNKGQQPAQQPSTPPAPDTARAPSTGAETPRVPATGPEDFVLMTFALAITAFMLMRYLQARRRLTTL
ncbi:MAG: hypothetical protein ACREGJ_00305 [Candidatus Saccharimonadales bacterium]